MASAPAPSVASTKETTNYARLCRLLVDVGSQALRDTFDRIHPPAVLHLVLAHGTPAHNTLQLLRKEGILIPTQWARLYSPVSSSVSSANLDITLLILLLRNICHLTPPVTGWDKLPSAADTSTEANIARVKFYGNTVYGHASHASADDTTFNSLWQDISQALVTLGGASYRAAIDKLKNECMDPDVEEYYRELLKQWQRYEDSIKDNLEEMEGLPVRQFMASASAPSVGSTKETTNNARLCRLLLDIGSQALRDTFDRIHPPAGLHLVLAPGTPAHDTLQLLRKKRILNPIQWGKLYPAVSSSVSSANFDIRLLMVLLTNICNLTPPVTGWDKLPFAADTSTEANLARVKFYRNTVYGHSSQASTDDATFNSLWQDISQALIALGGVSYRAAIDKLRNECMDAAEELFTETLKEWKRDEASIKEKLKEIRAESRKQLMKGKDIIEGVPPEIAVRGRLALEAYNKALAEGMTFDRRVPVMLIGRDRSGKTSLKKSLRGELFNPNEKSTVGIDVDPSHFELSTEIWTMPEKDQDPNSGTSTSYEHHVARATVEHMTRTRRASASEEMTPEATPSENVPAVETVSAKPTSMQEIKENRSDKTSNHPNGLQMMSNESVQSSRHAENEDNKPRIPNDVQTAMIKFLKNNSKVEDEDVYAVLWDFAGQSVYYTTHPIFLTPRAIYLLAYDLSKNPHEKARPIPRQGLFQEFTDNCGLEFNSDYLDFWMSSVASLASQEETDQVSSESEVLSDKLPAVFLVCTHADTPYDSLRGPKTLANELYGSLRNKPYKRHLRNLFVVNNTKSGRGSECPGVKHLRKELQTVIKQLPQMKEPIPIKWLNYEKKLQAKGKLKKWIDVHEAKRIASEECNIVDEKDFRTVLNFLHDKRILIHFSDTPKLDKLVVLDPQWLVDVFKKVITIPPYNSEEKEFEELWCKLQRRGILEETLLHHVWKTLSFDKETTESVLEIMEKFSLLCSWPSSDASCGEQYLMPSMLTTYPSKDSRSLVEAASAQIPPLFVKFESGLVPPGLFPRLVLLFLQWGKENRLNPVKPLLYHNFARCFISEDTSQSVVLLCLSSSIKVVVHRGDDRESGAECLQSMKSGSLEVFAGAVCKQLELILESMRKEFCWLKNMRYKLSFICPVCCQGGVDGRCDTHWVERCKKEECLHFLSLSELYNKKTIDCNESAGAPITRVDIRQFEPWFASPGYQLTGDEHNEESLANLEERTEIALPGELQESLLSQSCEAKDVVLHLKETMQLDQASLEKPDPETRKMIRCFARKAKDSKRLDVVQHLREITPAGTTGPLLPEKLNVRDIPVSRRKDLTIDLSGGEEWKEVAERLGLTPREIRFLDNRTLNPFDAALAFIARRRNITVADLYELLNECGYPVIADLL